MTNSYVPVIGSSNPASAVGSLNNNVVALVASLAYTDTTAKTLFTIPDTAVIIDWILNVTTAFNDTGTDQVSIGVTGTAGKFASAVDVSTTGLKTTGVVLTQVGNAQSGAQIVKGIYAGQNSNADAGAMYIIVRYCIPG